MNIGRRLLTNNTYCELVFIISIHKYIVNKKTPHNFKLLHTAFLLLLNIAKLPHNIHGRTFIILVSSSNSVLFQGLFHHILLQDQHH